jgi:hypothetical protein
LPYEPQRRNLMKKKHMVLAVVVMCLSVGVAWAATGMTTNTMTSVTKAGGMAGPWIISASGTVGIDSTVKNFNGLLYTVTNTTPTTYQGFTNLPNGPPTAGGAAVSWTGTSNPLTVKDNYSVVCTMGYLDMNNMPQKMSSQSNIKIP